MDALVVAHDAINSFFLPNLSTIAADTMFDKTWRWKILDFGITYWRVELQLLSDNNLGDV